MKFSSPQAVKKLMRGPRLFELLSGMQRSTTKATTTRMPEKAMTDGVGVDVELPALGCRQLLPAGSHQAAPNPEGEDVDRLVRDQEDEEDEEDEFVETPNLGVAFTDEMKRAAALQERAIIPVQGNVYRYWALRAGAPIGEQYSDKIKSLGLVFVAIIQTLAPAAIIISTSYSVDWGEAKTCGIPWPNGHYTSCAWYDLNDRAEHGVSWLTSRILGLLFILAYSLWAMKKIDSEKSDWLKISALLNIYESEISTKKILGWSTTKWFLWLGPTINCFVMVSCAIAMGLILKISDSPKDVVFDSLSLLFLIKLDDLDSDLGFLEVDDWNAGTFGEFVYNTVQTGPLSDAWFTDTDRYDTDPRQNLLEDPENPGGKPVNVDDPDTLVLHEVTTVHPAYTLSKYFMIIILLLSVFFWVFVTDFKENARHSNVSEADVNEKVAAEVTKQLAAAAAAAKAAAANVIAPEL